MTIEHNNFLIKYEYSYIFRHREANCRQTALLEMKSHFQQCNLYIPFKMVLKNWPDDDLARSKHVALLIIL
jgi:hypothetical protein